jgi:uncharacterized membrane protein YbhN (UPF0104 family)
MLRAGDGVEGSRGFDRRPGARRHWGVSWGRRLRAVAPWVVAAAVLGLVLTRVPFDALKGALAAVSWWQFVILSALYVVGLWLADALAMWVGFRVSLPVAPSYGEALLLRGASLLLALVSYGAGQGGIVYFLYRRHRISVAESAGAVLLTTGAFLLVVALVVGAGLAAGAVPDYPELRLVALAVGVSLPVYFTLIHLRPAFLRRYRLFAPLFAAGVWGTLAVGAARMVHLVVLLLGHWTALHLFGVDVPPAAAMVLLPVLFLISAIPIAPAGLGTTQAAAVTLFATFAAGGPDAQRATVLAYSLAFQFVPMVFVAAIGLPCLRLATRAAQEDGTDADATHTGPPAPE